MDVASWADEQWQMMSLVPWGLRTRQSVICKQPLNTAESQARWQTRYNLDESEQHKQFLVLKKPKFQLTSPNRTLREGQRLDRYAQLLRTAGDQCYLRHGVHFHSHRCDYVECANCGNEWNDHTSLKAEPAFMCGAHTEERAAQRAKMSFYWQSWMILQIVFATITTVNTQGKRPGNGLNDGLLQFGEIKVSRNGRKT